MMKEILHLLLANEGDAISIPRLNNAVTALFKADEPLEHHSSPFYSDVIAEQHRWDRISARQFEVLTDLKTLNVFYRIESADLKINKKRVRELLDLMKEDSAPPAPENKDPFYLLR